MIKQFALIIILVLGIGGTVLLIQKSTLLQSFGYDVIDFVSSFHASEGEAEFNPNLDVYKDGVINVMDVLKDRYAQIATRSGSATNSANLTNIITASSSAEATSSAN